MFGFHTKYALLAAIALCAILAVWRGAWPERVGAGTNLAGALSFEVAQRALGLDALEVSVLLLDGVFAFVLLGLTVRYAKVWLGVAMLLQAVQFGVHAWHYVAEIPFGTVFAIMNNVVSWSIVACLATGIAGTWRSRQSAQRPDFASA